ncbi:MAG: restriction endonuclease subunit S [Finegoldia magna]|nr:restriction endonuclease subunit S [Finegoldia magna]
MSRLEELIKELCPDGVEYKVLGELCNICTGKLNANAKDEDGIYPFFTCDANPYKINEYAFDTSAILISGNGSQVGHLNQYEGKFNAYQRTYVLDNFKLVIKPFLFHFMDAYLKSYIMLNCKKGSVPYITLPMLQSFNVPVPPLEVQREIVRILDSFTLLTAELTAELTARKKQYEFYRDELIQELCPDGVEFHKIKDVYTRLKGTPITASKMKEIANEDGDIRIFAGGKTVIDAFEDDIPKANITRVPAVLVQSRGVIDVVYYDKPFTFKNEMWAYTADTVTEIKYLYYVLKNNINTFREVACGMGSLPQISLKVTEEFKIPVPTIEEQQRIVDILDRFDSLCNDITTGLPAEIEARQKQYEFYRDKLLSFKQL